MSAKRLNRDDEALARRVAELLDGCRPEAPFYTIDSLAKRLSVTPRTVRNMISRGVIRSYRVESVIRIAPEDVDGYLKDRIETARAA